MNTAQAKKIPLEMILSRLGLLPAKRFKGGEELAYHSPFREEKEPSLFINVRKNVWNDFGDIGGNVLDFVMRYNNTDVKGALEYLDQLLGKGIVPRTQILKHAKTIKPSQEPVFLLESTRSFGATKNSLVEYITIKRGINPEVAARYLKEVHFANRETGKKYFAAGFENMSGGYEIRNPFFKGSVGKKEMSFVKGTGEGKEVWIFEGFMDFLSKLSLDSAQEVSADALILNSVSYVEKSILFLKAKGYDKLLGFLDNDKAGGKTTENLKLEFGKNLVDMRLDYQGFKDINDCILL